MTRFSTQELWRRLRAPVFLFGVLVVIANPVFASEPHQAKFPPLVAKILSARCADCHGGDDPESRLDLSTLESLVIGGEGGRSVLPGHPQESLLWQAIADGEMPPQGESPLSDGEKQTIFQWIESGQFPSAAELQQAELQRLTQSASRHWAFRAVREPEVPPTLDARWPLSDIDRFILARLETAGLQPVGDADSHSLLRRACFDITGLPPSPSQVEEFRKEFELHPESAFRNLVDRLLESVAFGDRWGRHWLDVARYSDTLGGGSNFTLDDAWRYRDYVIGAFNSDLPYDQFVTEQIAGDLLPFDSAEQHERQLIATGFLALGPKDFTDQDKVKLMADSIDEQMDTLGKAFMGLAIGCARCHRHKFDPIPIEDYYSLVGIFRSTQTLEDLDDTKKFANAPAWNHIPLPTLGDSEEQEIREEYDTKTESLRKQKRKLEQQISQFKQRSAAVATGGIDPSEIAACETAVADLDKKIKGRQTLKNYFGTPTLPTILGVVEGKRVRNARVNLSGNPRQLGHEVPRGTLRAIGSSVDIPDGESGRLQLAQWLADPQHPLSGRVMVNRVWNHLMGQGIVASVDNFGTTGTPPSHPELLDHLALRFAEDGWSVKSIIRRIMLSRVYRLASEKNPAAEQMDPGNRLLWKRTTRRLDVEAIHDSLLQIGGLLSDVRGGPTLIHTGDLSLNYREDVHRDGLWTRRSVYLPVYRNTILEQTAICSTFDFADPNVLVGSRTSSIVPTQALFLMNNKLSLDCAEAMARRLIDEVGDDNDRIRLAHAIVFGRPPREREVLRALAFLQSVTEQVKRSSDPRRTAWTGYCQSLFSSGEFLLLN